MGRLIDAEAAGSSHGKEAGMRLVRFMGAEELRGYFAGTLLRNDTDWSEYGKAGSIGFCFFPADPPPEERLHYISGVVTFLFVAEFEAAGPVLLRKSTGVYRDPTEELPDSLAEAVLGKLRTIEVEEYSTREYSRASMQLVRLGIIEAGEDFKWHIRWCSQNVVEGLMKKGAGAR